MTHFSTQAFLNETISDAQFFPRTLSGLRLMEPCCYIKIEAITVIQRIT